MNSFNSICNSTPDKRYRSLDCTSMLEDTRCSKELEESAFFFNKTCFSFNNTEALLEKNATFSLLEGISPTEEFFE